MKLNFFTGLDSHDSNRCLVFSSGCGQACLGISKVMTVSQLYLKNELSYEVKLLHVGMDAP